MLIGMLFPPLFCVSLSPYSDLALVMTDQVFLPPEGWREAQEKTGSLNGAIHHCPEGYEGELSSSLLHLAYWVGMDTVNTV